MYLLTGSHATNTIISRITHITHTKQKTLATKQLGVAHSPAPKFEFTNANNWK
jgi:hypothetical protein